MEPIYFLIQTVVMILVVVGCLMLFVAYLTLLERKFLKAICRSGWARTG